MKGIGAKMGKIAGEVCVGTIKMVQWDVMIVIRKMIVGSVSLSMMNGHVKQRITEK